MFLYQIIIRFYYAGIWLAALVSEKPRKWINGRKNWRNELAKTDFTKHKWVWFHCSSFGEFQEGKFLIKRFRKEFTGYKILLTFFSPSGYEAQKNTELADVVFYLPLDTTGNAKYFLDVVKPQAAFFLRGDVWPNFITEIHQRAIPQFLVSFIFSSAGFTAFPQRHFYSTVFKKLTHIFVQNSESERIYRENNFGDNVSVCGNLRIENILETVNGEYENEAIKKFIGNRFCVIAGSTHSKDAELFLNNAEADTSPDVCWIIVPHEIDEEEIENFKTRFGDKMVRLSDAGNISPDKKLLCVDKVGILAKIYRYADLAFIGGGFTKAGVHSFLEAVAYGLPVGFGTSYRNYVEATDLLNAETATVIKDQSDLGSFIARYKNNPLLLKETESRNKSYLQQRTGATQKLVDYLRSEKVLV